MKGKGKLAALLRPPKPRDVSIPMHRPVFYVPLADYRAFKAACEKRGVPMSHVIAAFMADFVAGKYDE